LLISHKKELLLLKIRTRLKRSSKRTKHLIKGVIGIIKRVRDEDLQEIIESMRVKIIEGEAEVIEGRKIVTLMMTLMLMIKIGRRIRNMNQGGEGAMMIGRTEIGSIGAKIGRKIKSIEDRHHQANHHLCQLMEILPLRKMSQNND